MSSRTCAVRIYEKGTVYVLETYVNIVKRSLNENW
jgi:hypothetical protein